MDVPRQGGYVAQSSYSSIGYIAAAATGLCLAKGPGQRVTVFSGDGGFQMTAQCLSTQTRFKLNPIIFVLNNNVYGVEQWLADSTVFHTDKPFYESCVLHPWNYSKLADVWMEGQHVRGVAGCRDRCPANSTSPSIIQVVVPHKSIPDNAEWKTQ